MLGVVTGTDLRATTHLDPAPNATLAPPARFTGLDGLRGLAVIAVLVFHLWPRVLPGGFIGVSLFFTLSGFVITRALLLETRATGVLRLRAFWARRMRRLWPASAVTLALVVVVWFACAWMMRSIAIDVGAAFGQVANWRFLLTGQAYGAHELSPVAHFWSLSIEEQLYLVVPVVVWGCRRRPRVLFGVLVALLVASLLTTAANAGNASVVYYSTFTRAAELLVGALLAVVTYRLPRTMPNARARGALGIAGVAALLALAWLCIRTSLGTMAYYRGGLSALALLSALGIAAAIWSPGVARVLSVRPLLWLGAVSYGVYLIHWPIHVALLHTGMPTWFQPWVTLAGTFAFAQVSLQHLELPVRERRVSRRVLVSAASALTAVIVVGVVMGAASAPASAAFDFVAAERQVRRQRIDAPASPARGVGTVGTVTNPVRVAVFGDSTALMLAMGIGGGDPRLTSIGGMVDLGCPIGRGGWIRGAADSGDDPAGAPRAPHATCDWKRAWIPEARRTAGADVGIVLGGNWDVAGRRIPALANRWRVIGDRSYDTWLRAEIAGAADGLHGSGVERVLWLSLPVRRGSSPLPRVDAWNAMVRDVAASRPWMTVVDYAGYLAIADNDSRLRPDGVHLSVETAGQLSREWLNREVVAAAQRTG